MSVNSVLLLHDGIEKEMDRATKCERPSMSGIEPCSTQNSPVSSKAQTGREDRGSRRALGTSSGFEHCLGLLAGRNAQRPARSLLCVLVVGVSGGRQKMAGEPTQENKGCYVDVRWDKAYASNRALEASNIV
jgi:hypothetical protein